MAMGYAQIIQRLPEDTRLIMLELVESVEENLRQQLAVRREDFDHLQASIDQAHQQSEQRLSRLETAVAELAEAQKRTELRVEELAEAQKRTELRVEELAEAQKRTELRVEELAEAQKRTEKEIQNLAKGLQETRSTMGGLSQSIAYALENEAYRLVPALLKEKYGIELTKRLIRTEIAGEEINLFGEGKRNGQDILIVGESKNRLDERRKIKRGQKELFEQLQAKIEAVKTVHPRAKIVPVIITHYARPVVLEQAQAKGIIIIQSFEW
jgi:chromosome segregation ATPase